MVSHLGVNIQKLINQKITIVNNNIRTSDYIHIFTFYKKEQRHFN